jgi:putative DNA primase/helicase
MLNIAGILRHYFSTRLPVRRESSSSHDAGHADRFQTFEPVGLNDFLARVIPPREMLLAPILPERSLAMAYSPRGLGKSWLGLSIGVAVASGGSILRWAAPAPRRVLYVDGEMPLADLQGKLNAILSGLDEAVLNSNFRILSPLTIPNWA